MWRSKWAGSAILIGSKFVGNACIRVRTRSKTKFHDGRIGEGGKLLLPRLIPKWREENESRSAASAPDPRRGRGQPHSPSPPNHSIAASSTMDSVSDITPIGQLLRI